MALLDDLNRMREMMRAYEERDIFRTIIGGGSLINRLPPSQPTHELNPLFRMEVRENRMFPYEQTCGKCGGSGDGEESTFCANCKGAGRYRVEGVAMGSGDKMCVLMHFYPSKPVRWPASVAVPKRPSQGIRGVPWPNPPTPKP